MFHGQSSAVENCTFCERIEQFKSGQHPSDLIAELDTGYLLLMWYQFYRGYCLFVSKEHATELDELPHDFALAYHADLLFVHRAVRRAVKPVKMNVASLGNQIKHVHYHIIPRHADDPRPSEPIWDMAPDRRQSRRDRITDTSHLDLIEAIRRNL